MDKLHPIDVLNAAVTKLNSVIAAVVAREQALAALLYANSDDSDAILSIAAQLNAKADVTAAAIVANTPAATASSVSDQANAVARTTEAHPDYTKDATSLDVPYIGEETKQPDPADTPDNDHGDGSDPANPGQQPDADTLKNTDIPSGAGSSPDQVSGVSVAVPTISATFPSFGEVNSSLTIKGTNFSTIKNSNGEFKAQVFFGETEAGGASTIDDQTIIVNVPAGVEGSTTITVRKGSVASNGVSFSVTPAPNPAAAIPPTV